MDTSRHIRHRMSGRTGVMVVRESRSKNTDTVDETLEILHRQPVNELYIGIRARLRHLAGESSKGGKYGDKDGGGKIQKRLQHCHNPAFPKREICRLCRAAETLSESVAPRLRSTNSAAPRLWIILISNPHTPGTGGCPIEYSIQQPPHDSVDRWAQK